MRNEWMEIFSQEGYRFCKVKPEETGVFYKFYEEGFHLVMFIDGTNGYLPTMGQLQVMQERVQELFYHPVGRLQDFPEGFPVYHVELLTILLTNQSENAKQLCSEGKNIWIYDQDRKQLIIYENQPGDFWGLKNRIEHMDVQQNSRASAPVSGKHSIMQLPFVTGLIALANILVYIILSFGGCNRRCVLYGIERCQYSGVSCNQSSVVAFIDSNVFTFWSGTSDEQYGNFLLCRIKTGEIHRSLENGSGLFCRRNWWRTALLYHDAIVGKLCRIRWCFRRSIWCDRWTFVGCDIP